MEQYISILRRAASDDLPDPADTRSGVDLVLFRELYEAGYIEAIDASSFDGPSYVSPRITLAGREYLTDLDDSRHGEPPKFVKWLIWLFRMETWKKHRFIAPIGAFTILMIGGGALFQYVQPQLGYEWCLRVTPRMDGKHTHCFATREKCDEYRKFAEKSLKTTPLRVIEQCKKR